MRKLPRVWLPGVKMKTLVFLDSYAPDFNVENSFIGKGYKFITDSYFNFLYSTKVMPWLKSNSKINKGMKIIALDIKTYERLKQKNVDSFLLKYELKSKKEMEQDELISEEAVKYAKGLLDFSSEFRKIKEYDGLSLPDLEVFYSYRYVERWIKKLRLLSSFVEKQKKLGFSSIVVFNGNTNSLLLKTIAKNAAMKFDDESPAITQLSSFIKKSLLPAAAKMMMPAALKKMKAGKLRGAQKNPDKKKVLVLTDTIRTLRFTAPWAKLTVGGNIDLLTVGLRSEDKKIYEKENLRYEPFSSYCSDITIKNINQEKRVLASAFSKFKNNPELRKKLKYEKYDFAEVLFELMAYLFETGFPEVVSYVEILKNIYETEKPDLVVVFGDITKFARTAALAAKARGIKTLMLQHGGLEDIHLFGNEIITDKIALFGSRYEDIYLKMGISKKRLAVVGNVLYDRLIKMMNGFDKKKVFGELGLALDKKLVTYMSVPELNESEQEALMAPLLEGIHSLKNVQLVIKLHPTERDIDLHKKIAEKYRIDAKIIKDYDTYKLIWVSDAVITTYSTVGSETAVIGRPLITLNYFDKTHIADYSGEGIALPAMKNNVAEVIEKALYDENARQKMKMSQDMFAEKSSHMLDGKAGERIKELIEKMASS